MKKNIGLIGMSLCMAALTACGAPASQPASDVAPGSVVVENGDPEYIGEGLQYNKNVTINNGEPVELTLWTDPDYEPYYRQAAESYTQLHSNVSIEVVSQPWDDYWTKLPLTLQNGTGPDVFRMHEAQIDTLEQYLLPLTAENGFAEEDLKAAFPSIEEIKVNGNYYSLPLSTSFGAGIYYNKAMWADAGLTEADIPTTWDEFIQVAKKLHKVDANGNTTQYGFSVNKIFEEFVTELNYQHGAPLFKEDQFTWNLDNPVMYDSIEFIRSLQDEHGIIEMIDVSNEDEFGHGQAAMIYAYNWVGPYISSTFPEIEWGYFLMPTDDGSQAPAYGNKKYELTLAVTKNEDVVKQETALDFVKFFINDASYRDLVIYTGGIPAHESLQQDAEVMSSEALQKAFTVADRMVYIGQVPTNEARQQGLKTVGSDIFLNGADPVETVQALQQELMDNTAKNDIQYKSVENQYKYYDLLTNR